VDITSRRLRELGGAARRRDLGRLAGAPGALGEAIESGAVRRHARGIYAVTGASPAVVAAATHGAAIGCVSAAELHGVAVLTPAVMPHLAVPAARGRTASGVRDRCPAVIHREGWVSPGSPAGVPVAPLDVALARMLLCLPPAAALVSIDSALNKGRTTPTRIAAALPSTSVVSARVTLSQADGRSMSPLETLARLALRAAGLGVEPAVLVASVGLVDLVVEGRVVVELDGFEFHRDRHQFQEDRRRDRELVAQGYLVLRFTARDVLRDIDRLVGAVLVACARAGAGANQPHL
jgi:hypothetical protein